MHVYHDLPSQSLLALLLTIIGRCGQSFANDAEVGRLIPAPPPLSFGTVAYSAIKPEQVAPE